MPARTYATLRAVTSVWVLLVRHGQSTWNAEGLWQGWADPPLSPLGEQQALDAVEHLRNAGLTKAVSSDLQRARRTAESIASELGLGEVEVDPDLRERNVGAFSGRTGAELRELYPDCFDAEGRVLRIPNGEEPARLEERAITALLRLAHRHAGERLLVATHSGVIRQLERHLGEPPKAPTPNLGGRWLEVCDGGRIDLGDPLVTVEPELVTRPATE